MATIIDVDGRARSQRPIVRSLHPGSTAGSQSEYTAAVSTIVPPASA